MRSSSSALVVAAALAIGVSAAQAQLMAPSTSGAVNYIEGQVFLDGKKLPSPLTTEYPYVGPNGELRTGDGMAEILMNPGVFVRLGEGYDT